MPSTSHSAQHDARCFAFGWIFRSPPDKPAKEKSERCASAAWKSQSANTRTGSYIPENYKYDADYNKKLDMGCKRADRRLAATLNVMPGNSSTMLRRSR